MDHNKNSKLIQHMKDLGVNQKEFADMTGVSKSLVSALVLGKRNLTEAVAKQICQATGEDWKYLMTPDEPERIEFKRPKVYALPPRKKREKLYVDTSFLYRKGHSLGR